jgi:hypothetical protein
MESAQDLQEEQKRGGFNSLMYHVMTCRCGRSYFVDRSILLPAEMCGSCVIEKTNKQILAMESLDTALDLTLPMNSRVCSYCRSWKNLDQQDFLIGGPYQQTIACSQCVESLLLQYPKDKYLTEWVHFKRTFRWDATDNGFLGF